MLRNIIFIACLYNLLWAGEYTIEIKKNSWNLLGTSNEITVSQLDIQDDEYMWVYKADGWYVNKDITGINKLENNISSNSGFWIKATKDRNITLTDNSSEFIPALKGWTLYSFDSDFSLNDINSSIVNSLWSYDDKWSVYGLTNEQLNVSGLETLISLTEGKGYWINTLSGFTPKVTKFSTEDVEDIWKLALPVNINQNYTDLQIAVNIIKNEKDGTPDTGTFLYQGITIQNSQVSSPVSIYIAGVGDSGFGSQTFEEDDIINNSLMVENGVLYLTLGKVMKKQTQVEAATFKNITTYDIEVSFDNDNIKLIGTIEIK